MLSGNDQWDIYRFRSTFMQTGFNCQDKMQSVILKYSYNLTLSIVSGINCVTIQYLMRITITSLPTELSNDDSVLAHLLLQK